MVALVVPLPEYPLPPEQLQLQLPLVTTMGTPLPSSVTTVVLVVLVVVLVVVVGGLMMETPQLYGAGRDIDDSKAI